MGHADPTRARLLAALLGALVVAGLAASCVPGTDASGSPPGPGRYLHGRYGSYAYALYVPPRYRRGGRVPLVVVVHGCSTTADQQARVSNYDPLAARHDFLVLYPDNGLVDVNNRCWKGSMTPQTEGRGMGDAAAIAGMTRAVMAAWSVDPRRVYVIGMSSGAFEVSIIGAAYPDLFAAIGIHSGAAYMRGPNGCIGAAYQYGPSTGDLAAAAYAAEGPRARIVPVVVLHGDADGTVPYECGRQALTQWLQTDDDVLTAAHAAQIPARPAATWNGRVPSGHSYTVQAYREPGGCTVAQFWTIHGMGHFWSGGPHDPSLAFWTDPSGPSAAAASWAFFSAHRLTPAGAAGPCFGVDQAAAATRDASNA
jgi:poly(hydroxyalkanoate) depolymerase family esterase